MKHFETATKRSGEKEKTGRTRSEIVNATRHCCNNLCTSSIELRYILPKEVDLYDLGLVSQEKLNLALSHVNSSPKEALNGKSPWDLMSFLSPDLYSRFIDFGLVQIERDTVVLKPYLLK